MVKTLRVWGCVFQSAAACTVLGLTITVVHKPLNLCKLCGDACDDMKHVGFLACSFCCSFLNAWAIFDLTALFRKLSFSLYELDLSSLLIYFLFKLNLYKASWFCFISDFSFRSSNVSLRSISLICRWNSFAAHTSLTAYRPNSYSAWYCSSVSLPLSRPRRLVSDIPLSVSSETVLAHICARFALQMLASWMPFSSLSRIPWFCCLAIVHSLAGWSCSDRRQIGCV